MPRLIESHCVIGQRPRSSHKLGPLRRTVTRRCKLDPPARLIAPPHSLHLPTLEGVRTRFRFSAGAEPVLPLARSLVEQELLGAKHLEKASSVVEALQAALTDIVIPAFGDGPDQFSIELGVTDALDEYRKPERNVVFFIWNNAADPQYIPLRPIYERLNGNPRREELVASLYLWLYRTASRVFEPFGFIDAQHIYQWRRDAYISEREAGEDVDLEGDKLTSGQIAWTIGGKHGWSHETQLRIQQFLAAHRDAMVAWAQDIGGKAALVLSDAIWLVLIPILAIFFSARRPKDGGTDDPNGRCATTSRSCARHC
jgi:hypothetical protein